MQLHDYQQEVLDDLEHYLSALDATANPVQAYAQHWANYRLGAVAMPAYQEQVPGVPQVCVKVPTAGGKTFIAANALAPIFRHLEAQGRDAPRLVLWLVPSLAILDQTLRALADSNHPYRQQLNRDFSGRVEVYRKEDILTGRGFAPDSLKNQLSVAVLSFDSIRAGKQTKDSRKVYQDNGYLQPFAGQLDPADMLPEHDETALINVLRALRPVVVVDESHNATSDLSVDMLKTLNPSFILDLTATPRASSNIISFVDAAKLKRNHMVKLPVIVQNCADKNDVVARALELRRNLEAMAQVEAASGGAYIRPIVLFQAEPKTGSEPTDFVQLKKQLIGLGIPEAEIRIKTAEIDELKNETLGAADCAVRYIITVNALKEGWDCPFAYVLATLANKSSAVDVEQILGRILRQPYARRHSEDLLNYSYVFTASDRFIDTLSHIVAGLNRAGFSEHDCREVEAPQPIPAPIINPVNGQQAELTFTPTTPVPIPSQRDSSEDLNPERVQALQDTAHAGIEAIREVGQTLETQMVNRSVSLTLPPEIESKMKRYSAMPQFADELADLRLPQFFMTHAPTLFDVAGQSGMSVLKRENLLKDFPLSQQNTHIAFDALDGDTYAVDLQEVGKEEYQPRFARIDPQKRAALNRYILSLPPESQVRELTGKFTQMIGNMYPIPDQEIRQYLRRVFEGMDSDRIRDCLERDYSYVGKIKARIRELATEHAAQRFDQLLMTGQITLAPQHALPEWIAPARTAPALPASLYQKEGEINGFEQKVINEVANHPNVHWWHRNPENGGFHINGFINHYPDFLVRMKSGKLVVLETKGDDRDNSDSRRKLKLGRDWASHSGGKFVYLMVFDNQHLDGAQKLGELKPLLDSL
jgi:type III restriction enzyme